MRIEVTPTYWFPLSMARGKRTKIIKRLNKETPEKANNPSAHSAASYRPRPFVFLRYSPKCSVPLLSGTVFSPSSLFMTKIRRHLSGRAANACSSRSILPCKEFGARIPSDIEVFKPFHKPHHTANKGSFANNQLPFRAQWRNNVRRSQSVLFRLFVCARNDK